MQQNRRDTLRCSGRVSANSGELWRIVFPAAAKLTVSLTVAVQRLKKPFVYAGFNNLNTDGHRWTQIFKAQGRANYKCSHHGKAGCFFILHSSFFLGTMRRNWTIALLLAAITLALRS